MNWVQGLRELKSRCKGMNEFGSSYASKWINLNSTDTRN